MISITTTGSFKNTERFLNAAGKVDILGRLAQYGQMGVSALRANTPIESGLAAASWGYEVYREGSFYIIAWTNSDIEDGFPVAIALQYGYATGTGGYVHGRDYINPALRPIFDKILDEIWQEVITS